MRNLKRSSKAAVSSALALGTLCLTGVAALPGVAEAACADIAPDVSNDLALECLIAPRAQKASSDPTLREQTMYRSLISELSTVMAVPVLEPADTTGYSGFHFSFDVTATTVSNDKAYWGGYQQPDGKHALAGVRHVAGKMLPVASIMLRKGIWFPLPPLPSMEIGFGASNLLQSGIYGLNGYVKLALHEGYHRVWVPSIAARATVTRIAGAPQVDLTIITAEGIISKAFGVGGTFTLEPYLGGGALFSIARSQVIDTAPTVDLYRGPTPPSASFTPQDALTQKVVFPTQDNILRWRLFAGINMHYAIVSITGYFSYFGAGADNGYDLSTLPDPINTGAGPQGSAAACRTNKTDSSTVCPKDLAADQFQVGGSVGLRF